MCERTNTHPAVLEWGWTIPHDGRKAEGWCRLPPGAWFRRRRFQLSRFFFNLRGIGVIQKLDIDRVNEIVEVHFVVEKVRVVG